ncbi:MAG: hypothetical protein DRJ33_04095 [Candidatus Methanomethylicota archaeon]|uniref:Uncharacterized protein n=1 Tax=Thermoproteota archaeon TaxID=2056631 RepID=A0A497EZ39_9CREN|nr:MAG: hypothetical protein DRJ33_04095 [Candidatus Verstraetearchaeota archaeon]
MRTIVVCESCGRRLETGFVDAKGYKYLYCFPCYVNKLLQAEEAEICACCPFWARFEDFDVGWCYKYGEFTRNTHDCLKVFSKRYNRKFLAKLTEQEQAMLEPGERKPILHEIEIIEQPIAKKRRSKS